MLLNGGIGLFWLIKENDIDPILGVVVLACANDIDFGVAKKPGGFPYSFKDRVVF